MTEHPPFPAYRAWSERERRWLAMAFEEYQAWLARPDLDPVEFTPGEVPHLIGAVTKDMDRTPAR